MAKEGTSSGGFAVVITRIAAFWVLVGACFKLFLGTPADLPEIVKSLPPDIGLTFRIAIAAELAIGLLAFLTPRWSWLLLMTLLMLFDVALITQIREGQASCGCFGSKLVVSPEVVLWIDSFLILLIVASRPWTTLGRDGIHALAIVMLLAVAIPLPWVLDREASGSSDAHVVGRPWQSFQVEEWVGRRLADLGLPECVDLEALPDEGLWIFYRDTCEVCAELLEWLAIAEDGQRPIVLLQLPDAPDEKVTKHGVPVGDHVAIVYFPDDVEWVVTPPAGFVLRDGCVVWALTGMTVPDHELTLSPPIPESCR